MLENDLSLQLMNSGKNSKRVIHKCVKLCWLLELAPSTPPTHLTSVSSYIACSTQRSLGRVCYRNYNFPGAKLPYMILSRPPFSKRVSALDSIPSFPIFSY